MTPNHVGTLIPFTWVEESISSLKRTRAVRSMLSRQRLAGMSRSKFRWPVVAAFGWLLGALAVGQQAAPNDRSFEDFLRRFVAEQPFRLDRTTYPLPVRIGNPRVVEVRSEKWTRKQVQGDLPSPLTPGQLKVRGSEQRLKRHSSTKVDVIQFRPEADSYILIYTFQRLKGRWYLTRFENTSKEHWGQS
jgi:hypothetical protein